MAGSVLRAFCCCRAIVNLLDGRGHTAKLGEQQL